MKVNTLFALFTSLFLGLSLTAQEGGGLCQSCLNNHNNASNQDLPDDGNGSLGQIYNQSMCGLNWTQGSRLVQTRSASLSFNNNGTGNPTTVQITGLPACYIIERAYVWYTVSYQPASPANTTVTITNPVPASATYNPVIAGSGPSKCWGESGTRVYRADVTASISGNGTYTIQVNGLSNASWEIDGATLFIIYRNPSVTYQGTLVIHDGNMTGNWGNQQQTMTGINACGNSTFAEGFLIVSDMQANVNGGQHPSTINGATANYPNNFYNFDMATTNVTAAQATAQFATNGLNSDCFTFSMMGLYFQTTSCTTCVPVSPNPITISSTTTNATCNQNNGTATATPSGGTPPYTYSWNTTPPQTTQTATGLAPGTYIVTITDASGCASGQDTVVILNSGGFTLSSAPTNVSCNGGSNGSATVTATGGNPPFTYLWNPSSQTSATATGLSAGTYTATVTDGNGCTDTVIITITQPPAITIQSGSSNVLCPGGNSGSATAVVSGGNPGYTYSWAPGGQTSANASNLTAGTYTLTVTDASGCTLTSTVTITQPPPISLSTNVTNVQCNGGSDGSASASGSGGTSPYFYSWNTAPVQNTATATGLTAGTYIVTVTDAQNCTFTQSVTVTQPPPPPDTLAITASLCEGDSMVVLHAPPGFTSYQWYHNSNPVPGGNADSLVIFSGSPSGYTVTWLFNGCIHNTSAIITTVPNPYFIPDTTANVFTPNGDNMNDLFFPYKSAYYNPASIEYYAKEFKIQIFNRWGTLVYETTDYNPQWDGRINGNGKDASAGVYYWVATYVNRCEPNRVVVHKGFVHLLR